MVARWIGGKSVRRRVTEEMVEAAALGGGVFGGGGGGAVEEGKSLGYEALSLGQPELVTLDEMPKQAILVTVSAVGAPAGGSAVNSSCYCRAVEVLSRYEGKKIDGLIANECGGLAAINGWLQSALLGIPVVDAPCNGRAHPTGVMGSIGLHSLDSYISVQAAVGGDPRLGNYLEMFVRGNLEKASAMVRQASVQCGGLVAGARNPVTVEYAAAHAAPGAVWRCIELGRAMLGARTRNESVPDVVAQRLGGAILAGGKVISVDIKTQGGFDVGRVVVDGDRMTPSGRVELTFWNEYMCVDGARGRCATFPDLIATLRSSDGFPLTTAAIRRGDDVAVVHVPRSRLILGAGMKDPALFVPIEQATGKEIIKYVFRSACGHGPLKAR